MKVYFGIVGVLCLVLSVYLFARRIRTLFYGATAIGTVLRIETRESDDSISHFPIMTYVDIVGTQHTFTSTSGVVPTAFPPGTKVLIRYSTSNPKSAYIANWRHMWGAPITVLFLGIMGVWAAIA
jgi:hypothetical protein